MKHLLIVHTAGDPRPYISRLTGQGFRFSLLKKRPSPADHECFERVFDLDYQENLAGALTLAEGLHADDRLHGVLSFSESGVLGASLVAAHLDLPGNTPRASLRARNKFLMRKALADAGLATPPFHLVRDASSAQDHLIRAGRPMVLKPISGSSSYGVVRLSPGDQPQAIAGHIEAVRAYIRDYRAENPQYPFEFWLPDAGRGIPSEEVYHPDEVFLLEGFVGGKQVSVDGIVSGGAISCFGAIEIERIKDDRYFLEFEEWMPTRMGSAREAEIQAVVERTVRALGLTDSCFHCELKIDDGAIYVLEIAARRGADNISDFLARAVGVDIYEEGVRLACGEQRIYDRLPYRGAMKMRYFIPDRAGVLQTIEGIEAVRQDPRVCELNLELEPGDPVVVPPEGFEFLGYMSVFAPTLAEADAALEELYSRVRFRIGPAAPGGPLLVVQPSVDYARQIKAHFPNAVFLASPERAAQLRGEGWQTIAADLHDPSAACEAVLAYARRRRFVYGGIVCFVCDYLSLTAYLAVDLKLPFHDVKTVLATRDKAQTAAAWRRNGLPLPATRRIAGLDVLLEFARAHPGPWILKPRDGTGSEWVLKVDKSSALPAAHHRLQAGLATRQGCALEEVDYLAQQFVSGREFGADIHIDGDQVRMLRLCEKYLVDAPGLAGLVGAYYPARIDGETRDLLTETLKRAADALGIERGLAMVDLILAGGVPYLLELSLRPGGDCLPDLCRAASGYDPVRTACRLALGLAPDIAWIEPPRPLAALHLLSRKSGILRRLDDTALLADPRVERLIEIYHVAGEEIRCWPGSYDDRILASCLVHCPDPAELPALSAALSALLEFELESSVELTGEVLVR